MPVVIEGLDELKETLQSLPRKVRTDVLRVAANKAGAIMREEIRYQIIARGLVDTGKLFDSITIHTQVTPEGVTARVGTGKAFYGMFHEFGTRKMAPHPFMRPALIPAAEQIFRDVGQYIGRGIEVIAERAIKKASK
jgi:HK97 gp10 family phage protein